MVRRRQITPKYPRSGKLRLSARVLILYLIISLVAGIGIGYVTRSGHVRSLNSDIDKRDEQISKLTSDLTELQARIDTLESDLQQKQIEYDLLSTEQSKTENELETLRKSYETLLGEVDKVTLEEVRRLTEKVSLLTTESKRLSSELSKIQIENEALKGSLDAATKINASLTDTIAKLTEEKDWLEKRVAQLEQQVTPSPDHALPPNQVWGVFKSDPEWLGRDYELQKKVEDIGRDYFSKHTYISGETDCNDMAVDLWNILWTANIKSVIVIGKLDKVGEKFTESDHAWLDIFDAQGRVIYLEPVTGEVLYGRLADGSTNTKVLPYREGWIYEKPSDLWQDLKKMW